MGFSLNFKGFCANLHPHSLLSKPGYFSIYTRLPQNLYPPPARIRPYRKNVPLSDLLRVEPQVGAFDVHIKIVAFLEFEARLMHYRDFTIGTVELSNILFE